MDLVWRDRPSGLCPFDQICEVRDQIDGPFDAAMAQRFAAAVDLPGNEVPQETAMKWLLDLLHELAPD